MNSLENASSDKALPTGISDRSVSQPSLPTSEALDLTNCDREPIHIPGSIQPHGVLLVISEADLTIVQVSKNVTQQLGRSTEELLNQPLKTLLNSEQLDAIAGCLSQNFAALETMRLATEAKQIQFEITLDDQVQQVSGDSGRLQQVVWNLLSNAVKFTDKAGRIEIRLTQVDHHAQVQIIDSGRGINPDFVPYIFEYFRQADGSTTRKFGGLGLGLAIARQIVELHGGTIWAESAGEGYGATLTFQIPGLNAVSSTISAVPVSPLLPLSLAGIRVLIVDDDTDALDFLSFLLEQSGAIVTTAATAAEALQALECSQPDILLSDIGMPKMDGYDLIRAIRASEQGQDLPAIAITAYAGELNQRSAIAAGFQHHIAKPIDSDQLILAIGELVGLLT